MPKRSLAPAHRVGLMWKSRKEEGLVVTGIWKRLAAGLDDTGGFLLYAFPVSLRHPHGYLYKSGLAAHFPKAAHCAHLRIDDPEHV